MLNSYLPPPPTHTHCLQVELVQGDDEEGEGEEEQEAEAGKAGSTRAEFPCAALQLQPSLSASYTAAI